MQAHNNTPQAKTIWYQLRPSLKLLLLLFSLILTACGQSADPQQGVIAEDKLSAPLPKAMSKLSVDENNLVVEVVINGDTDNPLPVENLKVDKTMGTFSGDVFGVPTGTFTLSLVYSIKTLQYETVEVIRTSEITVTVVANEDAPVDFSSTEMTYTDTDGDGIHNLDELENGTKPYEPNYSVGGQIQGLTGSGLVLQNNGGDDLPVSANNEAFTFETPLITGSDYTVTILSQPTNPNQTCTVNNDTGSGTINGAAITQVTVTCETTPYTIGGTVSGYEGSGLVLQNNEGDDLLISENGNFVFKTPVPDGSQYVVTVKTRPSNPDQVCTVNKGHGTVKGSEVSNIVVICNIVSYTVGGAVSGYDGSGLVLQNNGGDDLPINDNGEFTFATALANGSNYTVTVKTQPSNPNQICTVNNESGTINGAPITNVTVTCATTTTYTIGGTVFGYEGNGLVLQNNGGDDLSISGNGGFTFATALTNGSNYAVTVKTQPSNPEQVCTVDNDTGTVDGAPVTNIAVICKTRYTLGGTINGLAGHGLVLQNNGGDDLPISENGNFEFNTAILDDSDYVVAVLTQPSEPTQVCTVSNRTSTVDDAAVTNITVTCEAGYTIGGTVSGLAGSGLVLQNNGGDDLPVSDNGTFNFATTLTSGSNYAVTVKTQPSDPQQICTVSNGVGTVSEATVNNITVTCEAAYTIGGTISGLAGSGLVLQNNGSEDLPVSHNGNFTFATTLINYAVTVKTQPSNPNQTCTVENGNGTINGAPITNIIVTCVTTTYTIGGTVSGYEGSGLVLQNNRGDNLSISENGKFVFKTPVPDGSDYAVTVKTSPSDPNQVCTVSKEGNGTMTGGEVSNIVVTCAITPYKVGGTVSGYEGNGLVLQNNGRDDRSITANGRFVFRDALADGSDYEVTVKTQPSNPNQFCTVDNDTGTVDGAAISNVTVTCVTTTYTIGGTVSGYEGSGLVLQNNGGDDLPISENGNFVFKTPVPDGNNYAVTVKAHPSDPQQICTVHNGVGTVSGTDVTNITVVCKILYTIGGTISGLTGHGLVLQNNGGDDLPISENGNFVFKTPVPDGNDYAVTVHTRPSNPNQICTVGNGTGTVDGALVTNITVACKTLYTIDGTISGLAGHGLVLQNNGDEDLPVSNNGDFAFKTPLTDGSDYAVTVRTQPSRPDQTCTVSNGTDIINTTIIDVIVTCVTPTYPIKVTVTGLADGDELVLQNNGGDDLPINDNGKFVFKTPVPDGSAYNVTVLTQPGPEASTQRCIVESDAGFVYAEDVNVTVNCQWLLFIRANDGTIGDNGPIGEELFVMNDTATDISLVKNINTSTNADPHNLIVAGGVTYFVATDGTTGNELWKIDGSETGGAVLVKDIQPGSAGSSPSELTAMGDTLYFSANDGTHGHELWKSDGTEEGTSLVKDLIGPYHGTPRSGSPNSLTTISNTLYFASGRTLWKSDGTEAGTEPVKQLSNTIKNLTAIGDTLYFGIIESFIHEFRLWKSDGTTDGTVIIDGIWGNLFHNNFTGMGDILYFTTYGRSGPDLLKSDGTSIKWVQNIRFESFNSTTPRFTVVDNTLYFGAYYGDDGANGRELWKSDGTTGGTIPISDIRPGKDSASLDHLTAVGDTLYFSADDGERGNELWKSDGTPSGTVMVEDIQPGPSSASPGTFIAEGDTLYFSANDGNTGRELWKSDGAGTGRVHDIYPGKRGSTPGNLSVINGFIYFAAHDGITGRELWRSDGTENGSELLADIGKVEGGSAPGQMIIIDGISYFTANDGVNKNRALWRSDGTDVGTELVKDIDITSRFFIATDNTFYFTADDEATGNELWKSNGTDTGTMRVKDIQPGSVDASPNNLTVVGNMLYFSADDGSNGRNLWKSDGTEEGTRLVKNIQFGSISSSPDNLTTIGNMLYFTVYNSNNERELWRELWKSDGTEEGTRLVKNTQSGSGGSFPDNLTAVGNMLYFTADDGGNGRELWKSDDTEAGTITMLMKDIRPGSSGADPDNLTAVGNMLYFTADDGGNGRELWKTDGTVDGTTIVKDLNLNPETGSNPVILNMHY